MEHMMWALEDLGDVDRAEHEYLASVYATHDVRPPAVADQVAELTPPLASPAQQETG